MKNNKNASAINRRKFLKSSLNTAGVIGFSQLMAEKSFAEFLPNPDPKAVVETANGKIRGGISDGVHIFRGIPYGADTSGKNRFMPPQSPPNWEGIRDTLNFGNMAPQGGGGPGGAIPPPSVRVTRTLFAPLNSQAHSEDCLYLNVWSRGVNQSPTRPVMVWLHGGGFTSGSGASSLYEGTNLCRRGDVVVVTLNHRLGALAHLNLAEFGGEKFARSGMVGMLDIVKALEWVRDNIAQFGGDPNNVMIFGESGGGRKVSTLLAMPGAKGLFHRAVVHSGPGIRFPAVKIATRRAEIVMNELGLKTNQIEELQKIPFEKLIAVQALAERKVVAELPEGSSFFDGYGWSPVMGPDLPEWPFDPVASPAAKNIPIIIGSNRHEMALFISPNKNLDEVDEATLKNQVESFAGDHADHLIATYRKQYPQEKLRGILLLALADDRYRMDSIKIAERRVQQGGAPTYMYRFDWETPVWDGLLRASHALEIPFAFDNTQLCHAFTGGGPDAVALAAIMSETWIQFARTGNPNNAVLPEWKAYDEKNRATMTFNDVSALQNDPGKAEREVWKKIRP
ncbi:carboxylesterase/lipase family protein [Aurantivibrio infirmus]